MSGVLVHMQEVEKRKFLLNPFSFSACATEGYTFTNFFSESNLYEIGKKSPRSLASVDELPLIFLEFSFAVSKIIVIFVV